MGPSRSFIITPAQVVESQAILAARDMSWIDTCRDTEADLTWVSRKQLILTAYGSKRYLQGVPQQESRYINLNLYNIRHIQIVPSTEYTSSEIINAVFNVMFSLATPSKIDKLLNTHGYIENLETTKGSSPFFYFLTYLKSRLGKLSLTRPIIAIKQDDNIVVSQS